MLLRLVVALIFGAMMGLERELAGKEAGIRTSMMVASGAALFTIAALSIPYLVTPYANEAERLIVGNAGYLSIIGSIVAGIGFLGAGIIIKTEEHVHGLTTAAVIWAVAAVGVLIGIGLIKFAIVSAVLVSTLLYLLRILNISEQVTKHKR